MCSTCNDPFHGLEDDDLFSSAPQSAEDRAASARLSDDYTRRVVRAAETFTETCKSCRGRGRFISYTGRDCGPCYKCKGKGSLTFKTSPAQREAGRASAQRASERKAQEIREAAERFAAENPAVMAWIGSRGVKFEFAASMGEAICKYGHLTANQLAAVERCMARDAERDAQRATERAEREASAPAVDVSLIATAFATAQEKGIKRPKMILNGFKFSLAPATGRNAGALYVVRQDDDQYLGKIMDGKFSRVRECSIEQEAEIVKIASNPHAEAVAYGRRTGNCCICNRELTNHASIDAGIGPICAEKYGW